MNQENWNRQLLLSSIPLRQLNKNHMPVNSASCCLVDYCGKRIVLTVGHATGNMSNWAIEIRFEPGRGMKLYQIGAMTFLKRGNISTGELDDVDISYAIVPSDLIPIYQQLQPNGQIRTEMPRMILSIDLDLYPSNGETYGFAGQVRPEIAESHLILQPIIHNDLTFCRQENGFYLFRLPCKHPGHKWFEGCSGAPILDTEGRLISLVCSGNDEDDMIYGIALADFKTEADSLVGKFD